MDKKTLVIIAVILIVVIGAFLYFSFSDKITGQEDNGTEPSSSPNSQNDQDNQIPPPPALPPWVVFEYGL